MRQNELAVLQLAAAAGHLRFSFRDGPRATVPERDCQHHPNTIVFEIGVALLNSAYRHLRHPPRLLQLHQTLGARDVRTQNRQLATAIEQALAQALNRRQSHRFRPVADHLELGWQLCGDQRAYRHLGLLDPQFGAASGRLRRQPFSLSLDQLIARCLANLDPHPNLVTDRLGQSEIFAGSCHFFLTPQEVVERGRQARQHSVLRHPQPRLGAAHGRLRGGDASLALPRVVDALGERIGVRRAGGAPSEPGCRMTETELGFGVWVSAGRQHTRTGGIDTAQGRRQRAIGGQGQALEFIKRKLILRRPPDS